MIQSWYTHYYLLVLDAIHTNTKREREQESERMWIRITKESISCLNNGLCGVNASLFSTSLLEREAQLFSHFDARWVSVRWDQVKQEREPYIWLWWKISSHTKSPPKNFKCFSLNMDGTHFLRKTLRCCIISGSEVEKSTNKGHYQPNPIF